MNVGIPTVGFVDPKVNYRSFVLLGKGNPPQEEQKTLRVFKFPNNHNAEKSSPTYARRSTPYDRSIKDELNKPIRVVKSTVTTVEIDKPYALFDKDLVERALAVVNEEGSRIESTKTEEDTPLTVDITVKEEDKNNDSKVL